jgi:hypothetical protein
MRIADGSGAPWPAHRFPTSPVAAPPRDANLAFAHGSQIIVPPPVLYAQIPFPTEYPDGFTTFTQTLPPHRAHTPP